jgi:O-antigen/teichoic acid export membrane protein
MSALAWSRGETPILAHYVSKEELALFAMSSTLAGGAIQFIMLGTGAVGPHLNRLWFTNCREEALSSAQNFMSMQLLLSGIISLLLLVFGPYLLTLIFGDQYEDASSTLSILALTLPALATAAQGHLLNTYSNGIVNRNLLLIVVATLMIGAWALVPHLGRDGAAWARLAAIAIYAATLIFLCTKYFGCRVVPLKNLALVITAIFTVYIANILYCTVIEKLLLSSILTILLLLKLRTANGVLLLKYIVGSYSASPVHERSKM